jgi:predicted dehydrogenase
MTTPARIAVVGAGLIGQAHIKRILEEPEAKLTGIADPSPQSKAQAETSSALTCLLSLLLAGGMARAQADYPSV